MFWYVDFYIFLKRNCSVSSLSSRNSGNPDNRCHTTAAVTSLELGTKVGTAVKNTLFFDLHSALFTEIMTDPGRFLGEQLFSSTSLVLAYASHPLCRVGPAMFPLARKSAVHPVDLRNISTTSIVTTKTLENARRPFTGRTIQFSMVSRVPYLPSCIYLIAGIQALHAMRTDTTLSPVWRRQTTLAVRNKTGPRSPHRFNSRPPTFYSRR